MKHIFPLFQIGVLRTLLAAGGSPTARLCGLPAAAAPPAGRNATTSFISKLRDKFCGSGGREAAVRGGGAHRTLTKLVRKPLLLQGVSGPRRFRGFGVLRS